MSETPSIDSAVSELAASFSGELLRPGAPSYEEARRVHNGLIDKRPGLIARCRGAADVADAVNLGRRLGLEIAVRGGGHNVAGRGVLDGGLVIDLSAMKGIHVEAGPRRVRAQGGVAWRELNRETQAHGLATTGGVVGTTGIAGLTLGGGMGWLMGKYGLAIDNLLSVEVVTADGRILVASDRENKDLFWALRGGGGNFGVATSFEYRLHSVGPMVTGGLVAHPFEAAGDLLRFFRGTKDSWSDEATMYAGLIHSPDGVKLAGIVGCHCGSLPEAEAAMAPVKRFGRPVMDVLGPLPYCALNGMLDAGYPKGALNYWKSSFLSELSDKCLDTVVECYTRCPSPMSQILLEHVHGAATRVPVGDTAFAQRAGGYNLLVLGQWLDPADTPRCTAWVRETYAAMEPFMAAGRYVNYLGDDEAGDPVAAAYGPNYAWLQTIKAKYDPDNLFHMNQNIRPATTSKAD
jgi:FAD/FMN-containing dehydrogenase